ncbi:biopolymer transporter ExbD [Flammeovirga pectinis]|uniref:Biopolymer transporter ExbD n=1 Tax=Flammeovirga pectinis TaxID=2494373 RepID=A0A3Q9FR69_9BACT|nr:biopolymer transporter ExbD [Flammeovirga pectinis]
MQKKKKETPEINGGAMADIAFLLLIFFLVATTIASDKGVTVMLPPKADEIDVRVKERNVFNILVNSKDMMLAQEEQVDLPKLRTMVKEFVLNNGKNKDMSESPAKAIVSLKTDRGTSYEMYISVIDELKYTYAEMRAMYLKIPLEDYQALDKENPDQKEKLKRARKAIPYMVSDAEPSEIN